jgi:hypothetical protein
MTPEETRLLDDFLRQLADVPAIAKDRAAAAAIERVFERQPNAAYLVVQRALLLQQALAAAQAELVRLKGEPAAPQAAPRFLDPDGWTPRAATDGGARTGAAAGSFLGQAAAVAAGVAGGAFLFQGLNSLIGDEAGGSESAFDLGDLLG